MLSYPELPAKYCIDEFFYRSKLTQIALVGPGIHTKNGKSDRFHLEEPRLQQSVFGTSVNMKPPLTSGFLQRLAFTHIVA